MRATGIGPEGRQTSCPEGMDEKGWSKKKKVAAAREICIQGQEGERKK